MIEDSQRNYDMVVAANEAIKSSYNLRADVIAVKEANAEKLAAYNIQVAAVNEENALKLRNWNTAVA